MTDMKLNLFTTEQIIREKDDPDNEKLQALGSREIRLAVDGKISKCDNLMKEQSEILNRKL